MEQLSPDWTKKHIVKINNQPAFNFDDDVTDLIAIEKRKEIEPWLSAIFQSEHFSLLIGSGFTNAVSILAGVKPQDMWRLSLKNEYFDKIKKAADTAAKKMERGEANIEDDIRVAKDLIAGLKIIDDGKVDELVTELDNQLYNFISNVLKTESDFYKKLIGNDGTTSDEKSENYQKALKAFNVLKSFLLSFSSRAASRERLNIFTTNYDRFIELGCDDSGIILLDRFKGKLVPIFRNTRLELDYHYNPPGIRGEPRYVEGVVRITKLHGSIDWRFDEQRIIRALLPFGASPNHPEIPQPLIDKKMDDTKKGIEANSKINAVELSEGSEQSKDVEPEYVGISDSVVIYPNSAKDIETSFYPYAELFRDFSAAICRPNSVLVTYGYGFGDSHINRVIEDMLTIPSTHLVIIAWDRKTEGGFGSARDRIQRFYERAGNPAQFTLLVGEHFGDIANLVDYYLPKSAIDRLTIRKQRIVSERGDLRQEKNSVEGGEE